MQHNSFNAPFAPAGAQTPQGMSWQTAPSPLGPPRCQSGPAQFHLPGTQSPVHANSAPAGFSMPGGQTPSTGGPPTSSLPASFNMPGNQGPAFMGAGQPAPNLRPMTTGSTARPLGFVASPLIASSMKVAVGGSNGCEPNNNHNGCENGEEDECNEGECGGEDVAPQEDHKIFGMDLRPLLPLLLVLSTLMGAVCMIVLEFPLTKDLFEGAYCVRAFMLLLYAVTIGCMAYCALCDPGQLKQPVEDNLCEASKGLKEADGAPDSPLSQSSDKGPKAPPRSHKSWLFARPVRRYDHYCKWLANVIGLLNHREFVIMAVGLVAIGVCGSILDLILVIATSREGSHGLREIELIMHLGYSIILAARVSPILSVHIGLISRNETAHEWKRNDYYVINSTKTGEEVPVGDLSDNEFNERADSFRYDGKKNEYDHGVAANCWSFWCTPRWNPKQAGDF